MTTRSYRQFCGLAFALDIVGERWTLLIIRELLPGPRRYKDLMDGLPGISTNLLSERLKELEQQAVLCRRALRPPAGSTVYELTPVGHALHTAVLELGRWGSRWLPDSLDGIALPSLGAISLALQAFFHPDQARGLDLNLGLCFGAEALQMRVKDGVIQVQQGLPLAPAAVIQTDMQSFLGLFTGRLQPDEAVAGGLVQIEGDPDALRQLLKVCWVPRPQPDPWPTSSFSAPLA